MSSAAPAPAADRWFGPLLAALALGSGTIRMLDAPGWADYPTDAGPALTAIAHGDVSGFLAHQPAMGALSLYVRAPFAALAVAIGDGPLGVYRWGALPCVLAVVVLAIYLSRVARRRGTGRLGQVLIVAVCMLNPLINSALYWGHPEELLTASLAVGALLAAGEQRVWLSAVLVGLAVASKQWALVAVVPVLLTLDGRRIRALAGVGLTWAAVTLPMVVGDFAAFRHALLYISRPQPITTFLNWLYPVSPVRVVHFHNIFGPPVTTASRGVWGIVGVVSHPLIIALGVAIPLGLWWRSGRRLTVRSMLLGSALVLLLRCVLDPGSIAYYHAPLLLTLVALDATSGRRIPTAGIAGGLVCFVVLDRLPDYLGPQLGNALYIPTTLVAVAVLVRALRPDRSPIALPGRRALPSTAVAGAGVNVGASA